MTALWIYISADQSGFFPAEAPRKAVVLIKRLSSDELVVDFIWLAFAV